MPDEERVTRSRARKQRQVVTRLGLEAAPLWKHWELVYFDTLHGAQYCSERKDPLLIVRLIQYDKNGIENFNVKISVKISSVIKRDVK